MKVIGIVGSTRRGGNTEILTEITLEVIRKEGIETELISLAGKRIAPCDGCRSCIETGKCHIEDDFDSIFAKMKEADGIILATPVYYGAAPPANRQSHQQILLNQEQTAKTQSRRTNCYSP